MRPACISGAADRMNAMMVKLRLMELSPAVREATARKPKPKRPWIPVLPSSARNVRTMAPAGPRSDAALTESPAGVLAFESRLVSMDVSPRDPLSIAETRSQQAGDNGHCFVEPAEVPRHCSARASPKPGRQHTGDVRPLALQGRLCTRVSRDDRFGTAFVVAAT